MKLRKTTATLLTMLLIASVLSIAILAPVNATIEIKTVKIEAEGGTLSKDLAQYFGSDAEIKFEAKITHYEDGTVEGVAELKVVDESGAKFEAKWVITEDISTGTIWPYYGGSEADAVEFKAGDVEEIIYSVQSGRFGVHTHTPSLLNIVVVSAGRELLRVTGSIITEFEEI